MTPENKKTFEVSLDHICAVVKDAEATKEFLTSVLGLDRWISRGGLYKSPKECMVVGEPFVIKPMYCDLGLTGLELIQPIDSPKSVWAQYIERHGEGIHHIAINVTNWDEVVEELKSQGCIVLAHAILPEELGKGRWCYVLTKPGGIIFEIRDVGPGADAHKKIPK